MLFHVAIAFGALAAVRVSALPRVPPLQTCARKMLQKVDFAAKSSDEHETTAITLVRDPISLLNARDNARPDKFSPRPVIDRAITAAISTPHDAVLAELQGQRQDLNTSAKIDANSSVLPTIPSLGSLERGPGAPSPSQGLRSAAATPNGSPEPIYDPFTGTLAYVLPAQSPNDVDSSHFEQAKDELWSQLGRIRELQSEIAVMHVQMEGVGQSDSRPKKGQGRTHSDTIVGEEWPDPEQIEQEQKKARDAEFESLAKAFEGRHTAIGKIMNKARSLF